MRPIQQTYNIETADPNGVVTAETPVNNVALTLDGAYTSGGVATFPFPTAVTFTSTMGPGIAVDPSAAQNM
jgi:hypothetical protein